MCLDVAPRVTNSEKCNVEDGRVGVGEAEEKILDSKGIFIIRLLLVVFPVGQYRSKLVVDGIQHENPNQIENSPRKRADHGGYTIKICLND